MSKPKFNKFEVPQKLLDKLYELTGGPNCYKGFIIVYSTEEGQPIIYTKTDTQITEYGLLRALEEFLTENKEETFDLSEEDT